MTLPLALLTLLAGLGLFITAVRQRRASLEAKSWPTVDGIVRAAEVVFHPAGPDAAAPAYAARVRYDYSVDGQLYHGECISTGLVDSVLPAYPDALVLRYAPDNVALIHHHPTHPARSVLEIHPRGAGLLVGTAALALLAASAVAFLALAL